MLTWSDDNTARLWVVGAGGQEPLQSFQHQKSVNGAVFTKDESRVLTWSDDGTARLWRIADEPVMPVTERTLELELRTATQLSGSRELTVLNFDEWQAKKRELDAMRAKRLSEH